MSEYTPTNDEVREEFIYGHQELDMDGNVVVSFDEAQARWDRWLAEVERAAAVKALLEAADNFRYCEDYGYRATRITATEDYLRARAEAYRQERKEQ